MPGTLVLFGFAVLLIVFLVSIYTDISFLYYNVVGAVVVLVVGTVFSIPRTEA